MKHKLAPTDYVVLEGIKAGKPYTQIADELGVVRPKIFNRITKLVRYGVVIRTGKRGSYVYTVAEIEPEDIPDMPDTLLEQLVSYKLTAEQEEILEANSHLSRRELAQKLGISKLQLNHALDKAQPRRGQK